MRSMHYPLAARSSLAGRISILCRTLPFQEVAPGAPGPPILGVAGQV